MATSRAMAGRALFHVFLFSAVLVAGTGSAMAGQDPRNPYFRPFLTRDRTMVSLSLGDRVNQFDWNIASDTTGTATPNILSELTWQDIHVSELTAHVRHVQPVSKSVFRGGILIDIEGSVGVTVVGENQDSDYNGDNRTQEFSRSNNDADSGESYGVSGSVGYRFDLVPRKSRRIAFGIAPFAGYSWDRQQYVMTNGFQTIPAFGAFDGLNSEYTPEWQGPFAGLELDVRSGKQFFRVRGEYHELDYYAEAIWNLRDEFRQDPSYTHEGSGDGYKVSAAYSYALDSRYALTVDAMYRQRGIEDGLDRTFFTDGTVTETLLNEVNDESQALHFGLSYLW